LGFTEKEERMTDITIDIGDAETASGILANIALQLRQNRTFMKTQAQTVVDVWKCDAEMEFQDLHELLLIELEKKINALDEIRGVLDNAISAARSIDQSFG
jgi:uncharacterized protein YukE